MVISPPSCCIPTLSLGVLLWKHKAPNTHLITLSLLDSCILLSVHGALQDTGSPWTLLSSCPIQLSPRSPWRCSEILMNYNSLGAVLWGRAGNSPRRCKMRQIGIDHVSLGRYMTEVFTAKQHNPSPFCWTSTRGTNSQNNLKDQLLVWLLPPALFKPRAWPCHLGEGAWLESMSLAHGEVEQAINSCCKLSHLFCEVTFNAHYRPSIWQEQGNWFISNITGVWSSHNISMILTHHCRLDRSLLYHL